MAKDEFEKDKRDVNAKAKLINDNHVSNQIPNDYGICNKCQSFCYIERELGSRASCEHRGDDFAIDPRNKILKCTYFSPIGVLSISTMWSIAKIIDLEENKDIGFGIGDKSKLKVRDTKRRLSRYAVYEEDDE